MNHRARSGYGAAAIATTIGTMLFTAPAALAAQSGHIARFEQQYLRFVIDHHYGALRMAELAAGTDVHRTAAIVAHEGTSPTPNVRTTAAKAALDEIKSIARRDNRVQREEILAAQAMLMKWYRVSHVPKLTAADQEMIAMLEAAAPGAEFDKAFLRHMSHHHYAVLAPTVQCVVGASLSHGQLQRYCQGILAAQTMEIDEMRHLLCERYSDCHYQPFHMGNHPVRQSPEGPAAAP